MWTYAISHEGLAAMGDYLIYGLAGIQCGAPALQMKIG